MIKVVKYNMDNSYTLIEKFDSVVKAQLFLLDLLEDDTDNFYGIEYQ